MPKKESVAEISPIVIAPLGEPTTATTNVLQNVFQQKQNTTGSVVKSTVDKVFQTASTTNVPGKNTANVMLTVTGSPVTSGQQSPLILNAPRQKVTLSTPLSVQGYEAKVVPQLTPRPSATIGPCFTPGTQSAVSKQITPTPILQGPRTSAQAENRYVAPGSILQNEVMSQLLANPTTAMATFLKNSGGSAITTARPPNAISQPQAPLFPTGNRYSWCDSASDFTCNPNSTSHFTCSPNTSHTKCCVESECATDIAVTEYTDPSSGTNSFPRTTTGVEYCYHHFWAAHKWHEFNCYRWPDIISSTGTLYCTYFGLLLWSQC